MPIKIAPDTNKRIAQNIILLVSPVFGTVVSGCGELVVPGVVPPGSVVLPIAGRGLFTVWPHAVQTFSCSPSSVAVAGFVTTQSP